MYARTGKEGGERREGEGRGRGRGKERRGTRETVVGRMQRR